MTLVPLKLWTRVGPTVTRACTSVSRPRRRDREPLRIDAGDPVEDEALAPDDS